MGPTCSFGETETLQEGNIEFTLHSRWDRFALLVRPKSYERETESFQSHLGETEIPIGRTELLGFLAVAMSTELGGSGYEISVGPSLTFSLGHMWM